MTVSKALSRLCLKSLGEQPNAVRLARTITCRLLCLWCRKLSLTCLLKRFRATALGKFFLPTTNPNLLLWSDTCFASIKNPVPCTFLQGFWKTASNSCRRSMRLKGCKRMDTSCPNIDWFTLEPSSEQTSVRQKVLCDLSLGDALARAALLWLPSVPENHVYVFSWLHWVEKYASWGLSDKLLDARF